MIDPLAAVAGTLVAAVGLRARSRITPRREVWERRRRRPPVWSRRSAAVVGTVLAAAIVGPWLPATIAAGVLAATAGRPVLRRRRRADAIERALPDVVDLLVVTIRAGLTPRHALAEVGRVAPDPFDTAIAEVIRRTEHGEPFPDALRALPGTVGIRAAGIADAIATCERNGLPVEPLLDDLAAQARAARRRADQADARRLPVRLAFPLVTCTLPAYVLVAIVPAVLAALASLGGSSR